MKKILCFCFLSAIALPAFAQNTHPSVAQDTHPWAATFHQCIVDSKCYSDKKLDTTCCSQCVDQIDFGSDTATEEKIKSHTSIFCGRIQDRMANQEKK
jgi:hypothetical protein